ncbi:MAG: hypothetical protein KC425_15990, partial [Anaerolineales bacterium]|nr:hypothetical protein [Anaerolineales bacterium]
MPRKAPTALILIAAQFDELAVVTCLAALRQRGMAAALVGLGPGPVRSVHGVVLQPDASLAEGAA